MQQRLAIYLEKGIFPFRMFDLYKAKWFLWLLILGFLGSYCSSKKIASRTESTATNPTTAEKEHKKSGTVDARDVQTSSSEAEAVSRSYFGELSLPSLAEPLRLSLPRKNSVVLIVIDALNVKHLGIYGNKRPSSPNIDRLAEQGLLLNGYVSNSSWTRPSFTTIITGLPKKIHGVELSGRRLEPRFTTVAERFSAAGFRTAGFVGNPLVGKALGYNQGFQVYMDTKTFGKAFPPDELVVKRAIEWLKKVADEPFFLMLFLTAPHAPYRPPSNYRTFLSELPKGQIIEYPFREYEKPLDELSHDRMVAAYDGEIQYTDSQIGSLVSHLRASGKLKNTTLLLTADHGEVFGEHNCYTHTYHMWEPALRVPLLIVAESIKQRGVLSSQPFTHLDIAPTLFSLAGIEYPRDEMPGVSIIDSLASSDVNQDRIILSQYNAHSIRRQAVRKGRYKLIHHHKVEKKALVRLNSLMGNLPHADPRTLKTLATDKERYEYYDLIEDPEELNNIYQRHLSSPEMKSLMAKITRHLDQSKKQTGSQRRALSEETLQALRNAGYIN